MVIFVPKFPNVIEAVEIVMVNGRVELAEKPYWIEAGLITGKIQRVEQDFGAYYAFTEDGQEFRAYCDDWIAFESGKLTLWGLDELPLYFNGRRIDWQLNSLLIKSKRLER